MPNVRKQMAVRMVADGDNPFRITLENPTKMAIKLGQVIPAGLLMLVGHGGTGPYAFEPTTIADSSGSSGLAVDATGDITGTATQVGTFQFIGEGQDADDNLFQGTFEITVEHVLEWQDFQPPDAWRHQIYQYQFRAIGGLGDTTYSVITGAVPTGLDLSAAGLLDDGGIIASSGTTFNFTVRAHDGGTHGSGDSIDIPCTIHVYAELKTTISFTRQALSLNVPKNIDMGSAGAQGGLAPFVVSINPSFPLPDGVTWSYNQNDGSVTLTASQTFPETVSGFHWRDSLGQEVDGLGVHLTATSPNQKMNAADGSGIIVTDPEALTIYNDDGTVDVFGHTDSNGGMNWRLRASGAGGGDWYGAASGTNTYTVTTGATALTPGDVYVIRFANANTGVSTLDPDSLGAKAIYLDGANLSGGELKAGSTWSLVYNGTQFDLIGETGSATTYFRRDILTASTGNDTLILDKPWIANPSAEILVQIERSGVWYEVYPYSQAAAALSLSWSGLTATLSVPMTGGEKISVGYWASASQSASSLTTNTSVAFDPAFISGTSITLTSGNLRADIANVAVWNTARLTRTRGAGKYKIYIQNQGGGSIGDFGYGLCDATQAANTFLTGGGGTAFMVQPTYPGQFGRVTGGFTMHGSFGSYTSIGATDGVQICVDEGAGQVWISNATFTGYLNGGNPDAGTNPDFTFTPGTALYFALSLYGGVSSIGGILFPNLPLPNDAGNATTFTAY